MVKFDVFVGNIEFSVTDELLVTVFSEVGRVLDIRMKQEGGRPAGYGFVEYGDGDSCRAAIALLDGRPVNGRPMKVGHSHSNGMAHEDVNRVPLAQANAISQAVTQSFNHPTDALPVLREMRRFAEESPLEARQCLANHPNLALALLEMEITCGFLARPAAPHAAPQQARMQQGRPQPQQGGGGPDFGSLPPPGMSAPPCMMRDLSSGGALMVPPQAQRSFDLGSPPPPSSSQPGGFNPMGSRGDGGGISGHYHGGQQQQQPPKQQAFDRYAPPPMQSSYDPYAPPPQQQQQQQQQPYQPSPAPYQAALQQQQQPPPVVQSQQPMPQAQAVAPPPAAVASAAYTGPPHVAAAPGRARPADPRDPRRRGR